jgi:hypothetical protein
MCKLAIAKRKMALPARARAFVRARAEDETTDVRPTIRILLTPALLYAAWLGMLTLHETGHALHALLSGGKVDRITLPLIGFSRTDLSLNPHPQWVAWGGPVWGCLVPLVLLAIAHATHRAVRAARLFAGFCLIANGAYLGLGPAMTAGDAHDLLRHGAPTWTLIAFGILAFTAGLYLWHLATRRSTSSSPAAPPPPPPASPPLAPPAPVP